MNCILGVECVAGEAVELTVHKESVFVEEIKEVERISRRAQFIYDRNYNRIGQRSYREEVKTSVTQKEKSKGICMQGYPEQYHFLLLRG